MKRTFLSAFCIAVKSMSLSLLCPLGHSRLGEVAGATEDLERVQQLYCNHVMYCTAVQLGHSRLGEVATAAEDLERVHQLGVCPQERQFLLYQKLVGYRQR